MDDMVGWRKDEFPMIKKRLIGQPKTVEELSASRKLAYRFDLLELEDMSWPMSDDQDGSEDCEVFHAREEDVKPRFQSLKFKEQIEWNGPTRVIRLTVIF